MSETKRANRSARRGRATRGPATVERRTGRVAALARLAASVAAIGCASAAAALGARPAPAPSPASDPCASLGTLVSRPTVSSTPCSVRAADVLTETGYTNTSAGGAAGSAMAAFPQATVRVGLGRGLELDLVPPSESYVSSPSRVVGPSDSFAGLRYEIGHDARFVYGINTLVTIPTGTRDVFSSDGTGVLANADATAVLSPAVGLFATFGYTAQNGGTVAAPARFHAFLPSLGASVSLPQSTSAVAELFEQSTVAPGLGGRYGFDLALERDLGARLQLDVEYLDDLAVVAGAHQHAVGFGASYLVGR